MQATLLNFGRILFASLFLVSGVRDVLGWGGVVGFMQSTGLPSAELLLVATVALKLLGGLMLVFNRYAAPAAVLLAGFCLATAVIFHNFWAVDAAQYSNQLNHFMKNISLAGALLMVAGTAQSK